MTANFEELCRVRPVSADDGSAQHTVDFPAASAIWAVNGGYLGAAVLRAAEEVALSGRPASLSLQFLRGVKVGEASVVTQRLRRGSASELLEGRIVQDGKLALLSHLWVHDAKPSPDLRRSVMPAAPHPDELRDQAEMRLGKGPQEPFYSAFEQRRMNTVDWGTRRHSQPRTMSWVRYHDLPPPTSHFMAAAMTLPLIDFTGVAAACNGYGSNILTTMAPTIQLTAHFYELDDVGEWLLTDAFSECAADGLLNSRVRIWSLGGALVAQGLVQMIFTAGGGAFVDASPAAAASAPAAG